MKQLLMEILEIATRAGDKIIDVYENEFDVDYKNDGSPLTVADRLAHDLICNELQNVALTAPVVSEESSSAVFGLRRSWDRFWLVDPLDGTKEFVKRNGEFTVNIALIDNGEPVLGVVHTPVTKTSYYAARDVGSFRIKENGKKEKNCVKQFDSSSTVMVASRSHSGPEVLKYQSQLEKDCGPVSIKSMGSSLKICLVAEGSADIYPRLGPTSEWDTAAAHCVLDMAGGSIIDLNRVPLRYNKPNILNPWFLATGDPKVDWARYAENE